MQDNINKYSAQERTLQRDFRDKVEETSLIIGLLYIFPTTKHRKFEVSVRFVIAFLKKFIHFLLEN